MFLAFCYCCKQHITAQDEKEFRKSGHVDDKDSAKQKYGINISRLPKVPKYEAPFVHV